MYLPKYFDECTTNKKIKEVFSKKNKEDVRMLIEERALKTNSCKFNVLIEVLSLTATTANYKIAREKILNLLMTQIEELEYFGGN